MGHQSKLRQQRKQERSIGKMPSARVGGKDKTAIRRLQAARDRAINKSFHVYELKKQEAFVLFTQAVLKPP